MSKEVELKKVIEVFGSELYTLSKYLEDKEMEDRHGQRFNKMIRAMQSAITFLEAIEKAGDELPTKEKLESIFHEVFVSEVHNENLLMVLARTALKEVKPIIAKKDIRIKELENIAKVKFGMWLCPKCGKGCPSGKICGDCLEVRIKELEAKIDELTIYSTKMFGENFVLKDRHQSLMKAYNELIMAVGNKYEGETRHQTALRYIQSFELSGEVGKSKLTGGGE